MNSNKYDNICLIICVFVVFFFFKKILSCKCNYNKKKELFVTCPSKYGFTDNEKEQQKAVTAPSRHSQRQSIGRNRRQPHDRPKPIKCR